ncbi:hypothetical protein ACJU26_05925 [Acidithiobacillus sp. M4-SHS-6]|uniref:hypothetical protein n=1 Tax=Acidithiobacillus sp. M4-SHS-6 TaxID=3383024 RepID=UPI0039BE90FD
MTDWNEDDFPDEPFDYHDEIPEVSSLQEQSAPGRPADSSAAHGSLADRTGLADGSFADHTGLGLADGTGSAVDDVWNNAPPGDTSPQGDVYQQGGAPLQGDASPQGVAHLQGAEETFRRLAELHRQMLDKQYNQAVFRADLERLGTWIRSMDAHLAQLAHVENLAEQHQSILNNMSVKAQEHRQTLTNDLEKHRKEIEDSLKAMGNPLKKLDDLIEEQTRSFRTFSLVVNKIWWIFFSATISGALVGNLIAYFLLMMRK